MAAGQVVVSGHKAAVERAIEIAKAKGAKRAVMLPVSAPFHCAPHAAGGRGHARGAGGRRLEAPGVPLVANVTAAPVTDPDAIRDGLVRAGDRHGALARKRRLHGGAGRRSFYRVGAGKVLTGLVKRIAAGADGLAIGTPDDIAAFKAALKA